MKRSASEPVYVRSALPQEKLIIPKSVNGNAERKQSWGNKAQEIVSKKSKILKQLLVLFDSVPWRRLISWSILTWTTALCGALTWIAQKPVLPTFFIAYVRNYCYCSQKLCHKIILLFCLLYAVLYARSCAETLWVIMAIESAFSLSCACGRLCRNYRRSYFWSKLLAFYKPGGQTFWAPQWGKFCFFAIRRRLYSCSKVLNIMTQTIRSRVEWWQRSIERNEMNRFNVANVTSAPVTNRAHSRDALSDSVPHSSSRCRNVALYMAQTTSKHRLDDAPIHASTTVVALRSW